MFHCVIKTKVELNQNFRSFFSWKEKTTIKNCKKFPRKEKSWHPVATSLNQKSLGFIRKIQMGRIYNTVLGVIGKKVSMLVILIPPPKLQHIQE